MSTTAPQYLYFERFICRNKDRFSISSRSVESIDYPVSSCPASLVQAIFRIDSEIEEQRWMSEGRQNDYERAS
jgi:hypothetical protein